MGGHLYTDPVGCPCFCTMNACSCCRLDGSSVTDATQPGDISRKAICLTTREHWWPGLHNSYISPRPPRNLNLSFSLPSILRILPADLQLWRTGRGLTQPGTWCSCPTQSLSWVLLPILVSNFVQILAHWVPQPSRYKRELAVDLLYLLTRLLQEWWWAFAFYAYLGYSLIQVISSTHCTSLCHLGKSQRSGL